MIEQEIVQGDNFTITDRRDGANVIIVNQAFAKQLKADGDVLGLQISTGSPEPLKIIGIVKNITIPGDSSTDVDGYALGSGAPRVYGPNGLSGTSFLLKLKPEQSVNREQLGKLLVEIDTRYSVFSFSSADDVLTQSLFTEITTAVTTTALALITFFLASIGLYGILSYSTQMRRLELGTRMAVGAKRYDLILMIIKDNIKPIIAGVLFSLVILLSLSLSFNVELSPYMIMELAPMFFATILLILILSFLACYLPLRSIINFPAISSLRGNE
jgi:ABC-type antimicrobial peptide transport system permease subunit